MQINKEKDELNMTVFKYLINDLSGKYDIQLRKFYEFLKEFDDEGEPLNQVTDQRNHIAYIDVLPSHSYHYGRKFANFLDPGISPSRFLFSEECLKLIEDSDCYADEQYIINTLQNTSKPELTHFLENGLLTTIHKWLKNSLNKYTDFCILILNTIAEFPINKIIILQKSCRINDTIKQLCKDDSNKEIKECALNVKEKWKNLLPKKIESSVNENVKVNKVVEKPLIEKKVINFIQPKLMSKEEKDRESIKRKRETTDILGNVLKKTATNIVKPTVKPVFPSLIQKPMEIKRQEDQPKPTEVKKKHISWSQNLFTEHIFESDEYIPELSKSTISERIKMEYQNEKNIIHKVNANTNRDENNKPKLIPEIPYVPPPPIPTATATYGSNNYVNNPVNIIPKNPFPAPKLYRPLHNRIRTFEEEAEIERCKYIIPQPNGYLNLEKYIRIRDDKNIIKSPKHPILPPQCENELTRFFMAFPSVYYDIRKQNNIIPIDYFIPTLFRNHAVERSMYDRIGIQINNRLTHSNFGNLPPPPPPPPPPIQTVINPQQQQLPIQPPIQPLYSNSYYTPQQQQHSFNDNTSRNRKKHKRGKGSEMRRRMRMMGMKDGNL